VQCGIAPSFTFHKEILPHFQMRHCTMITDYSLHNKNAMQMYDYKYGE
jgi:hypothetical protein